jgi:hypothetical protein
MLVVPAVELKVELVPEVVPEVDSIVADPELSAATKLEQPVTSSPTIPPHCQRSTTHRVHCSSLFGLAITMVTMISGSAVALELLSVDPDLAVGANGRLLVALTLRPPSSRSMQRFADVTRARRRVVQQPLLCVFIPSAPRPSLDGDGRTAIRDLWHDIAPDIVMVQPTKIMAGVVADARAAVDLLAKTDTTLADETRSSWVRALELFALEHAPTS